VTLCTRVPTEACPSQCQGPFRVSRDDYGSVNVRWTFYAVLLHSYTIHKMAGWFRYKETMIPSSLDGSHVRLNDCVLYGYET